MACMTTSLPKQTAGMSIADVLRKIDQIQKEAILSNIRSACDTCMIGPLYNTKPIAIYTACGNFRALLGAMSDQTTNLFRIEEVRGNETVVLRCLEVVNGVIVCDNYTVVMNINCICAIECFEPINCDMCTSVA